VPGLAVFITLTGMPIMLTPFIADARGDTPVWAVLPPLAAVASLAILIRLPSAARPPGRS
jgi:hypothetical protein